MLRPLAVMVLWLREKTTKRYSVRVATLCMYREERMETDGCTALPFCAIIDSFTRSRITLPRREGCLGYTSTSAKEARDQPVLTRQSTRGGCGLDTGGRPTE